MKKFILAIAAAFMAASMASAQDMAQATELYNNGATAISMKNWTEALDCFQKALEMGKTIGADADELVANCKNAIPGVSLEIAKDLIKDAKYDEAAVKLDEVAKIAAEIEGSYRYKVNRGKLRKCLKSVLKKNSAAEVLGGYRRWLAVWEADDFQWAPSRITDWLYDAKFLEKPRRGNTRAAPQVDPDTVSSGAHLDLV